LLGDYAISRAPLNAVCIREVQTSLKGSSKKLVEDFLTERDYGANYGFRILSDRIETPKGGMITFRGMQDSTAESIKSLENCQIAWVDEAQTLSERSLALLRPTIRMDGSELWFSWNPRRANDPVDKMLRGPQPPTDTCVVKALWYDNPWFPAALEQERMDCIRAEPDQYANRWEGDYVSAMVGAYFARELALARSENRIGLVARDPLMSIQSFWDIGGTGQRSDACAIWIAQIIGREVRILDYYEAIGQPLDAHIAWLRANDYADTNAIAHLPHDGSTSDRVFAVSYESELRRAGITVSVTKNAGAGAAMQRIVAIRKVFASCRFDSVKCEGGIEALGWYHERRDASRTIGLGPDHDWSSHAADAFGLLAIQAEDLFLAANPRHILPKKRIFTNSWMG